MKRVFVFATVSVLALGLAACGTSSSAIGGYHEAVKAQVTGAFLNPTIGGGVVHGGVTVDKSANVDKNGVAIVVHGGCKDDSPDTFANMNANATASATSIGATSAAGPTISQPAIAVSAGDVTANGGAAIIAAAAMSAHPADVIAAYCQNAALPNAPAGTIVRDGIAPPVAAAAK